MASLFLCLFGGFQVALDGIPVTAFESNKVRALLAYLAVEAGRPHQRSVLAGLLWPDHPEELARTNLRHVLRQLRQSLPDSNADQPLLLTSQQTIQLNPRSAFTLDVTRFTELLAQVEHCDHPTLAECPACLDHYSEAAALYRGEFLTGISLYDSNLFEDWLVIQREQLHRQALEVFFTLAAYHEAAGDYEQARQYAWRQLELEPWREEAHRQLMRVLARSGQRTAALAQFAQCRTILADELGVEPDPETVALYEQIRRGDLQLAAVEPQVAPIARPATPAPPHITNSPKWSEMPETGRVYGREAELTQLMRWLSAERCQLVAVLGIGGVGKTTLAAASAKAVATDFDQVIWRSLLNAPPLEELLRGVLLSLAQQPRADLPLSLDDQFALLLNELRRQRCLLVFDNLESILQPEGIGQMCPGYEGYTQLLRQLAENRHTSCLLLTSRERPQGMVRWEEDLPWVRSHQLEGLDATAGQALLMARGLGGQGAHGAALVQRYSGHPLALKLVTETIQELFDGDIGAFLAADVVIFDDIRRVLDQQFARLPALEQEILFWLALERKPVALETLRANLMPVRSMQEVVQGVRALQRRSLVQPATQSHPVDTLSAPAESWRDAKFASPNVIMEYLVERLIETACREIEQEQLLWLHKHAFMQAQAMEYLRQTQLRLILQPIASRLETRLGRDRVGLKLLRLLHALRTAPNPARGYAVGNLLNLLILLEIEIGALDLAGLCIWQADLRQANLAGSNLAGADLTGSRFADAFNTIRAVAVSPDGTLVAGGTQGGELRLWDTANGRLLQVYRGHKGAVRSIAFRPDGSVLASGSEDRTVRLWSVEDPHTTADEGPPYARLLEGHAGRVTSVAFHPDGKTLASGSIDGTVCLWDVASGTTRAVLHGHDYWVSAVAMSPDGCTLASAGYDQIIRLWDLQTTEVCATFTGHTALVSSLAFDPTGVRLASGSYDCSVCVWELASGQKLYSLEAATDLITSVAISPDGKLLATGGDDWRIRLWDMRSGDLISVFHGHTGAVCSVAFSPDGQTVVSSGNDQRLCLWDVDTTRIWRLFSGHSQGINSLAFHPGGKLLASGHSDRVVRLWDLDNQAVRQVLHGHTLTVNCVAFSADGALLASGSDDKSIQVWTIPAQGNARRRAVLNGHQRDVVALDFHPDGRTLLSASEDQSIGFWEVENGQLRRFLQMDDMPIRTIKVDPTGRLLASDCQVYIRLWDVQSGLLYTMLKGHTNYIWSLAFSPDSHWLASGGGDGSIGLWDVRDPAQPQHRATLHGHADRVFIVAFHPNGRLLASGSADHTVRLWDMQKHEVVHTLAGHTHWVWTLAFSPDGRTIASGGMDETIRLWDSRSGEALGVYHTPGPYAGMNISGAKGISDAERTTLKLLGAIEQ